MNVNALMEISDGILKNCDVDLEQIEKGERTLTLPDGVRKMEKEAFSSYNAGHAERNISNMLLNRGYYLNQWKKNLSQKRIVKLTFPEDVRSLSEKAEYMLNKDLDMRLLTLKLPKTLSEAEPDSFPAFLEEITVDEDNPQFISIDGVLFSKDGGTLIRYPGYRKEQDYTVPEGVVRIQSGAFGKAVLKKLILPKSLRIIEDFAFHGMIGLEELSCESDAVDMGRGVFAESSFDNVTWWPWGEIPRSAFINSRLRMIDIPEGVVRIEDSAFAGCYRAERITVPKTVEYVGINSFDEGPTYRFPVTLPDSLYHFAFRFPAVSPINGRSNTEIWAQRTNKTYIEEEKVLRKQADDLEYFLKKLSFLQFTEKKKIENQLKTMETLLKPYQ